jgi:uncharacterized membrane protein YeaQ/YmgE (transglycosylase-associated protein family)
METLTFVIVWCIIGLIVGAVARVLVPGADGLSIPMTIFVGIAGALIGGAVGHWLVPFHGQLAGFLFAVAGAALIIVLMRRFRPI